MSADADQRTQLDPVVAFLVGLSIVLLASILNAAGLNLTKLDHVRASTIPKSARSSDWMRPLWLLGMLLYILSQLLGSTLALEYMRAEYVAPLGATSLVFNFLFARFLVGTPVTSSDIYGTIVVILGVIGIVAFGSINSGLASETDVTHLTYLWRRPGWLGYFFCTSAALLTLLTVTSCLDVVFIARNDLFVPPLSSVATPSRSRVTPREHTPSTLPAPRCSDSCVRPWQYLISFLHVVHSATRQTIRVWNALMAWVTSMLEVWTAAHDDKQIAWMLGIGWACCGGGLAGACLVFAKATVKLLTGSLSRQNPGNQFGHVAPIFTIILLSATAVLQIICLNRGLRVYDSTLVVPVFYGVYTATGFLDSLIFNDEVDAYQSWTLFLIFASILLLISGVVLLTHKKPEPSGNLAVQQSRHLNKHRSHKQSDEETGMESAPGIGETTVMWTVGEDESREDLQLHEGDEDIDHHLNPLKLPVGPSERHAQDTGKVTMMEGGTNSWKTGRGDEGERLIDNGDEDNGSEDGDIPGQTTNDPGPTGAGSSSTLEMKVAEPYQDDEFGEWGETRMLVGER